VGHERIGLLPKTKRWRDIVADIEKSASDSALPASIADNTLAAVGSKFAALATDPAVLAAIGLFIRWGRELRLHPEAEIRDLADPTLISAVQELDRECRSGRAPPETRELVLRAFADALQTWRADNVPRPQDLFEPDVHRGRWRDLGTGAGFCDAMRLFFGSLTARYLNYFLEREASSVSTSLAARREFDRAIKDRVDDVARYAFEAAKIAQSYSAGWFNKSVSSRRPTDAETKNYVAYCVHKLREEFRRERATL
jgi:hypothetical protein